MFCITFTQVRHLLCRYSKRRPAAGRAVERSMFMEQTSGKTARVSTAAGVPLHRQLFLVLHDEI